MDELVGPVLVFVRKDERMAQMHGISRKDWNRENVLNLTPDIRRDTFTEKDGGFLHIWSLTRLVTEVVENVFNLLGLL
jgi:hypothetical protein